MRGRRDEASAVGGRDAPRRPWLVRGVIALYLSLGLLPWATALLATVPQAQGFVSLVTAVYGLQCHQRSERALLLLGQALPVCARCTGVYLGLGLAALVGRPRLRRDLFKTWFLVGALVLLLDVLTEWVALRPPCAWLRVATGAFLSYAVGLVLLFTAGYRRD